MLLDLPHSPNQQPDHVVDCEKYLLYNDPFQGLIDSTLASGEGAQFAQCAQALERVENAGEWAHLFRTQHDLCRVLEYKAELGVRTRAAYQTGDRNALKTLIKDYQEIENRLAVFYESFRFQWDHENKTSGFEVQDIRLGGLRQRLEHCRKTLERYLVGEIDSIQELVEDPLDFAGYGREFERHPTLFNACQKIVTANVL